MTSTFGRIKGFSAVLIAVFSIGLVLSGATAAWAAFTNPSQLSIAGSGWPMRVTASSDNRHIYVADLTMDNLYVIDTVANTQVTVSLGGSPYDIVENAARTRLYIPALN
jgi:YVTN family beta-propeller protein